MPPKDKLIEEMKNKYLELRKEMNNKYGSEYPKKSDFKGWKLYGRLQGLSWALEKIGD